MYILDKPIIFLIRKSLILNWNFKDIKQGDNMLFERHNYIFFFLTAIMLLDYAFYNYTHVYTQFVLAE